MFNNVLTIVCLPCLCGVQQNWSEKRDVNTKMPRLENLSETDPSICHCLMQNQTSATPFSTLPSDTPHAVGEDVKVDPWPTPFILMADRGGVPLLPRCACSMSSHLVLPHSFNLLMFCAPQLLVFRSNMHNGLVLPQFSQRTLSVSAATKLAVTTCSRTNALEIQDFGDARP